MLLTKSQRHGASIWLKKANADNSHRKQNKWFSKYPVSIMYPTWLSKCFIYYLLFYLFIRVSKYSKASYKIKRKQ